MRASANSALAAALLLLVHRSAPAQPCVLRGVVVDRTTKLPVPKARVFAVSDSTFLKTADERGAFCFENVDAGSYQVVAEKAGYLNTWYRGNPREMRGQPITVAPGNPVPDLRIEMTARAILSGTVVDRDGNPVPEASVDLYMRGKDRESEHDSMDSTDADDRGRFRFADLWPGSYYLSASDSETRPHGVLHDADGNVLNEVPVKTFYPGVTNMAAAKMIVLQAGHDATDLQVPLLQIKAPERHVSGKVVPRGIGSIQAAGPDASGEPNTYFIRLLTDGTFRSDRLYPGRYVLSYSSSGQKGQAEVDLTSGDVTDVVIAAHPEQYFDVPVVVRTEGAGTPFQPGNPIGLWLGRAEDQNAIFASPAEDGTYQFRRVRSGVYHLRTFWHWDGYFIKQVRFGGKTVTDEIDFRAGAPGPIEVTLSSNVAAVEGRVTGSPQGLVTVMVFHDGPGDPQEVRQATADQEGRFKLGSLQPGKYRVLAIEDYDPEQAGDLRSAMGKGIAIELSEGDRKQVEIPVLPKK